MSFLRRYSSFYLVSVMYVRRLILRWTIYIGLLAMAACAPIGGGGQSSPASVSPEAVVETVAAPANPAATELSTPSANQPSATLSPPANTTATATSPAVRPSTPTSTGQLEVETPTELMTFVLGEMDGQSNNKKVLLAEVAPTDVRRAGPIDPSRSTLIRCWLLEAGMTMPCTPQQYLQLYQEDLSSRGGQWAYTYGVFATLAMTDSGQGATVRLDRYSGPTAGSGWEYSLRKVESQWQVLSRRMVWIS